MESQSVSLNAPNLSVGERVRIEGPAPLLLRKNCIGSVVMEIAGHLDGFDKDGGSKEQKPKCNSPKGVRNIKREYSSCVPHLKTALLLAHQQPNVHKVHFAKWLLSVKNIILHRNRHTSNTFEELWGLGYVVPSAHQSGTTAFALGSRLPTEMANKGTQLQSLSKVFVLLSIMTVKTNPLETVNVVDFCGQNIQGDGMIVNSHQESKKYYFVTMGTDCHLTMQAASPKDKVQFHFRFFLVYSLLRLAPQSPSPLFPESPESTPVVEQGDPCHAGSYIQFYDGRDKNSPPIGPTLCGKSPPRPVLSTGNHLTLRLVTQGTLPRVDFVGDFTSFRLGFNQSACSSEPYFPCRNGKCIPMSLVCDEKGIDNCGDGSDLEDHLPSGCKGHSAGQLAPAQAPPPAVTPPPPVLNAPTLPMSTNRDCGTPDGVPHHDSVTDSPPYLSLLALYIALGVIAGVVLLCWCCWSPGWFLWRISICRFLPCCNSACASCQLCARSCAQNKEHRPAKVSPQGQVPTNGAALSTLTTSTANATTLAV